MSGEAMASAIYMTLMLMLVASAFAARRIPMKQTLKMVLAWIAIFALGFLAVGLFNQFSSNPSTESLQEQPSQPPTDQRFT